jgi:glycerate 2-kinase
MAGRSSSVPAPQARRFLVAPDAFKGTLVAAAVARSIAEGLRDGGAEAEECPVADGGEGTIEVLAAALRPELREALCSDPLGRPIHASWAWLGASRTALIEMAAASGLALLDPDERDAERATSAGTGELIVAARDAGAARAILAVGGTATTDGGAGALERIAAAGGLGAMGLVLACDVTVPFERAAEVFGPQKGASAAGVIRLTERLEALAAELPRDPRGMPMSGAGGGLAGGMWAVLGAELRSGSRFVLETLGFDHRLAAVDAVVIGEGCLDGQSRDGKIAGEILDRSLARAIPVHAVVGSLNEEAVRAEWGELASVQVAGTPRQLREAGGRLAQL